MEDNKRKWVSRWLWTGVVMVFIQVIIGGITRLTGSGLSITEWNVLMGALPPLSEAHWQTLFDKYKLFPQYSKVNPNMDLHGFKTIFWWEYIHRLWARFFAVVFLIPFVWFLIKGWITKKLALQLVGLFFFGALQGLVGWVMVQSGLKDQPWVSPLKLSLHLILAFMLYMFIVNIALHFSKPTSGFVPTKAMRNGLTTLVLVLFVQVFFGGLMAGHKAALFYPTWPMIGGEWIPGTMNTFAPAWMNLVENKATIHFIHRNLAYVIAIMITAWWWKHRKQKGTPLFNALMTSLPIIVLLQVVLGVLTLLQSIGGIPIVLGVLHQGVALVLLTALLVLRYGSRPIAYNWEQAAGKPIADLNVR